MKIHVIIPVYNGEKYIMQAVDSVLKIQGIEIDIILVNDGSSDNSLDILRKLEREYINIHVISQENAGVSAARNRGIEYVLDNNPINSEDYIGFLDADDIWLDTISNVEDCAWENDIIEFSSLQSNGRINRFKVLYQHENKICKLAGENMEWLSNGHFGAALYKMKLIREYKLRFPVNVKRNEDVIFFRMATFSAKSIYFSSLFMYIYRNNILSVTHNSKYTVRNAADIPLAWKNAEKWAEATKMFSAHGCDNWKDNCENYSGVMILEMIAILFQNGYSEKEVSEWLKNNRLADVLKNLNVENLSDHYRSDFERYKKGLSELRLNYKRNWLDSMRYSMTFFIRRCGFVETIIDKVKYPFTWKNLM